MKRDPITNEQLCALAKRGDADAQNLLIENNLRFIKKTAYEVWSAQAELNRSLQISLDDLVQEGMVALFNAIMNYDEKAGASFTTFAYICVRKRIIGLIRKSSSGKNRALNDSVPLDDVEIASGNPETVYIEENASSHFHPVLDSIKIYAVFGKFCIFRFIYDIF
ncbi:MAG: hypothetical protein BHV91_05070 [Clostridiales bacterium 44_9]|nr:MAG: hypothetical protein BHV91_05070 [Clostridiales bacterium 44_9]